MAANSLLARHTSPAARVLCSILLVSGLALAPLRLETSAFSAVLVALVVLACAPKLQRLALGVGAALLGVAGLLLPLAFAGRTTEALSLGLRATFALIAASSFAAVLPHAELGGALAALRVPPVLAGVIETMLRQVAELSAAGRRATLALRLRGARSSRLVAAVAATLLVRSAERAERVDLAMRLRGYNPRHAAERARLRSADIPALALTLGAVIGINWVARVP